MGSIPITHSIPLPQLAGCCRSRSPKLLIAGAHPALSIRAFSHEGLGVGRHSHAASHLGRLHWRKCESQRHRLVTTSGVGQQGILVYVIRFSAERTWDLRLRLLPHFGLFRRRRLLLLDRNRHGDVPRVVNADEQQHRQHRCHTVHRRGYMTPDEDRSQH